MKDGKKNVAERVVYGALDILGKKKETNALKVFEQVIEAVRPQVEVRSKRVGGANYQVPMPVIGTRQNALAFRWILEASRSKKGQPMAQKLAAEIIAASKEEGNAVRKKNDTQRMAEANRAFAHFAQ
jgi:small subunit ribosomal protein S7